MSRERFIVRLSKEQVDAAMVNLKKKKGISLGSEGYEVARTAELKLVAEDE